MNQSIAYLVSRFPKLTETFILYEMQALEAMGANIELFALIRHRENVIHPEAQTWMQRAHYRNWYSAKLLFSQFYWFGRSPRTTLEIWYEILSAYRFTPKTLLRTLFALWLAFDFARQMQQMEIGHIHAHWATYPATSAYIIHRLTGIPYSLTAHAHDIYVDQTMLKKKMESAAFTVTISEHNHQLLQQISDYGNIRVLHCGVDTSVFFPLEKRQHELFTLITVAALEEKKGHSYLIEALQSISARSFPFNCLFVGEGSNRLALEDQIQKAGLSENVKLLGALPRLEIIELLKAADVMVLPSVRLQTGKQEGIPVALMEGMAMKLPVIASRISGVPELVKDKVNGLLVPEKDPVALAAAILELYHDADYRRKLGEKAREKVLAEFDQTRTAETLYALFKQSGEGIRSNRLRYSVLKQDSKRIT